MKPPKSARLWIRLNLKIGVLSFAPASRSVLYRDTLVEEWGWLTDDEFQEAMTVAQFLPGPNLVNLSVYLGYRLFGFPAGAKPKALLCVAAAMLCLGIPGALLAIPVIANVPLDDPNVAELFRGFSLGSVATMFVFLWRLRRGVMTPERSQARSGESDARKLVARFALVLAVAIASVFGVPLLILVAGSAPACLAVEFLL